MENLGLPQPAIHGLHIHRHALPNTRNTDWPDGWWRFSSLYPCSTSWHFISCWLFFKAISLSIFWLLFWNKHTILTGELHTHLPVMGLLYSGQKISKDTEDLNSTFNPLDLINVYRIFHLTKTEGTFPTSSCEVRPIIYQTRRRHCKGGKKVLSKYTHEQRPPKIEIKYLQMNQKT